MRELVKKWLLSRGIVLSRPPGQFSLQWVKLRNAQSRGLRLASVIDGGASDGSWAREFRQEVNAHAQILCVEPREECRPALETTTRDLPGVSYALTLIGATEGTVKFNVSDTQSSMLANSRGEAFGTVKEYPITTLDNLVVSRQFPWPDLIKLDLQGAELQALRGADECMRRAQMLLLEVSLIELQKGSPLLYDVVAFCHERGYRVYDIPSLWHRPLDGALAQGDFLFIKDDHALLADRRWSEAFA